MFDPTIHTRTLSRHLRKADFDKDKALFVPSNLASVVDQAVALGLGGLAPLPLCHSDLRGKDVYQIRGLAHNLVLRHITGNIRRVTKVKQDNREFIVKCIASLASEGVSFRVYKYDVKSFYESVHAQDIIDTLASDLAFSGQSVRALQSLFSELQKAGVAGLPRGMAISATLAEYLMRPFDAHVSNGLGVWYYSRFVDDILVITDGTEGAAEFDKLMRSLLPAGLDFNDKSQSFKFNAYQKGVGKRIEGTFSFLGYSFTVTTAYRDSVDNKIKRDVSLDIAPSKVKKIKTRIAKSLIAYRTDKSYSDLLDRVKVITGNFKYIDKKSQVRRTSGIYFNYPLIASDAASLSALDAFLRNAILNTSPRNKLYPALGKAERLGLLRLSFKGGHRTHRFFSFKPDRLAELAACWHYA